MDLAAIQAALREVSLDGWLFYDHHHRDPLAERILGLSPSAHVTRRWYYFVPATGEPRKLVHRIEPASLDSLPGAKNEYSSWQELESSLEAMLSGATRIAMQYSPRNAILYVSMVDAGTVELVRSFGKDIVSSADLVSQFEAILSENQIATHYVAQQKIDAVLTAAWPYIGTQVRGSAFVNEFAISSWLGDALRREGLVWEHGPNVSAGPNSADSHYEPTVARSREIKNGDFLLIDIWGKLDRPGAIFYDKAPNAQGFAPLYCVSPGNRIPAVKLANGEYEQLSGSSCPSTYLPPESRTFLSRLTFTFSIGPDF